MQPRTATDHELLNVIQDLKLDSKTKLNRVNALLDAKANPNHQDSLDNESLLFLATNQNNIDIVRALITAKADPNIADDNDDTPLMLAAGQGYLELAEILILKGNARLDDSDGEGNTALTWSIHNGQLAMTAHLLRHGASIVLEDQAECFKFLDSCDKSDPDFQYVLTQLCDQLREGRAIIQEGEDLDSDDEGASFLEQIEDYMKNLQELSLLDQQKVQEEIDTAINKRIHTDLLKIICAYDFSLERRQPADLCVDNLESVLEEAKAPEEPQLPTIVTLPGRNKLFKPVADRKLPPVVFHSLKNPR